MATELKAGSIRVRLVWFDSLGAKSSCLLVKTPDVRVLVDDATYESSSNAA